jgi:L-ascorbate metabolism protein UlaG (beta-lactamase superfamily)
LPELVFQGGWNQEETVTFRLGIGLLAAACVMGMTACSSPKEGTGKPDAPEEDSGMDTVKTSAGDVKITCLGHASVMFQFGTTVVHVDPVSSEADYGKLPKGDLVLVTHEHSDHLDPDALAVVRKKGAPVILSESCASSVKDGTVMKNGDVKTVAGLEIEAVPAYNVVHERAPGKPFHPRGVGNGYIVTFGDQRIYVAGDTENIPEMKGIKNIAVAFLPMNLPYTMTPEMVADAARAFRPKVLYPYHFGDTDTSKLVALLKGEKGIEVRIRRMK